MILTICECGHEPASHRYEIKWAWSEPKIYECRVWKERIKLHQDPSKDFEQYEVVRCGCKQYKEASEIFGKVD